MFAACALIAALWALAACGGEEPPVEPTAPEPPQQAETQAQPTPPDAAQPAARTGRNPAYLLLAEADALERNGFWEAALAARERAIAQSDAEAGVLSDGDRLIAQLDQARLLLELGRAGEADELARRLDAPGLPSEPGQRLALLAARAGLALDEPGPALAALDRYLDLGGPARAWAQLERARALDRLGRSEEARHAADRAIANPTLPEVERRSANWLAATLLDNEGDAAGAIRRYEEAIEAAPWEGHPDIPAALARIAALSAGVEDGATEGTSESAGEDDEAAGAASVSEAAWRRLIEEFPHRDEALTALEQLLSRGLEVEPLAEGIVRYRHEQWNSARVQFIIVLSDPSSEAERAAAEYYVAAINEELEEFGGALAGYQAAIGHDPGHALAADARWWAAELLEARGESGEQLYSDLFRLTPASRFAPAAAARHAGYALLRGNWGEAARRFRDAANVGADHWSVVERQRLLLWSGIAYRQAGDEPNAEQLWERTINLQPGDWYALRAADYLGAARPAIDETLETERWLTERAGPRPEPFALDAAHWLAAQQLRRVGYDAGADAHLFQWIADHEGDAWALWEIARLLGEAGETSGAAAAASACLRAVEAGWWEAPAELVRAAYPTPWRELAVSFAGAEGVDPLLLYSLIRRESLYDADARGAAGEIGLTQVIPLTGGDIARALGEEHDHERLARPETALRYGAWYLGAQLGNFDGSAAVALAAYNGGPGNAARWLEAAATTAAVLPAESAVDAFVSAIDFPSTQSYVRVVLEWWGVYRALAALER